MTSSRPIRPGQSAPRRPRAAGSTSRSPPASGPRLGRRPTTSGATDAGRPRREAGHTAASLRNWYVRVKASVRQALTNSCRGVLAHGIVFALLMERPGIEGCPIVFSSWSSFEGMCMPFRMETGLLFSVQHFSEAGIRIPSRALRCRCSRKSPYVYFFSALR